MKNLKNSLVLTLIALIAVSCGKKSAADNTASEGDTNVYRVKTLILEKQTISRSIDYTANIMPNEEIHYAPASPGRVEEVLVDIGSRVKKGDVIARMDPTQLRQAAEQYQNARSTFLRMDTLYKLNSIAEQTYEGAKTNYEVSKTSYDFLNKNTTLVSPINGIVTGKYFEGGELYSGAPNTAAGKAAIVTLMEINPVKVIVNVSERYYLITKKGIKAHIRLDLFPNRTFTGEISKVYPTISPDTRTFAVEILINNSEELLRPGMFTRVSLNLGETSALLLPAISVVKQEGTNDRYVYLANSDSLATRVKIEIGDRYNDMLEILSDQVKEGSRVIIAGQEKLMDGSKITIQQ
ncbi:MAG: efflux RND transporter periplasmic adaptor subunit [Bacteroidales bacterium]